MKWLLTAIFIFFTYLEYCKATNCTEKNLQTIHKCYADLFFNLDFSYPYLAPNFVQQLKTQISDSEGVIKRCRSHRTFRNCLKKDTSNGDIVENCVNVNDFLGLSYARNVTKWAKQYVASFIELEYICGDGYKVFSYETDCINQIPTKCLAQNNNTEINDFDCEYHEEFIQCIKNTAKQECGTASGCFAFKDSTINVCYHETNCSYCEDLHFNNNNFYNNLCDEDAKFIIPSTTTPLTTTTTLESATSSASTNTWTFLIFLFFSFSWIRFLINSSWIFEF